MPQSDLESLLYGGEFEPNSKVACETAFSGSYDTEGCDPDPYAPAMSFLLRIGEDVDWRDIGAVLEREDSTKGASNPKAATRKSSVEARSSWAAAGAPKAVIGGLPAAAKIGRECGRRRQCRLGHERAFVRVAVEEEPSSPKVSCLGGVRSQRRGLEPVEAARRRHFLVAMVRFCWNPV